MAKMSFKTPKQKFLIILSVYAALAVGVFAVTALVSDRGTKGAPIHGMVTAQNGPWPDRHAPQYASSEADQKLLAIMRSAMAGGNEIPEDDAAFKNLFDQTSFPKQSFGVALIIYQPGQRRMLIVRTRRPTYQNLIRVINRIPKQPRYKNFDLADESKCRIQLDFIVDEPKPTTFKQLNPMSIGINRFEMGVDGLRIRAKDKIHYFLPGDAFVKSLLSMKQLKRNIKRSTPAVPFEELKFERFQSQSFISFQDDWLRLYRGYPVVGPLSKAKIKHAAELGLRQVRKYFRDDGRFMYFYEALNDSHRDHDHPKLNPGKDELYYNMLRHAGGGLLLIFDYKLNKNPESLALAKRAVEFLVSNIRPYELADGTQAAYVYYNRKAKLGGSGIGLYLLAEYQNVSKDATYAPWAKLLNNHLLAQITETGEFMYYKIYRDKEVTEEMNPKYFSFYYPGEAVGGIATYYKYVSKDPKEKARIRDKLRLALKYLYVDRPVLHADQYTSLPSDSWLMMGINELWDIPKMRSDLYKEAVFRDADKMVDRMYTPENAIYPDYPGAFYYVFGNHPYADGARTEGLLGAYELAVKVRDKDRQEKYSNALKLAAWATLHLVNTPESVYAVPNPEKSVGGIRFKHTRQWFRIDTIQHVAAFYLKFLQYW